MPGEVKTRMQPMISPKRSAELHQALLLDTLDMTRHVRGTSTFLALAPTAGKALPFRIDVTDEYLIRQDGEDLGERLMDSIDKVLGSGFAPIVVIGNDCPLMRPDVVEDAINVLVETDVCIIPARDGGYCLIGMNHLHKNLFTGVEWSTDKVFDTTIKKACQDGLQTHIFEEESDVDTFEDARNISNEIEIENNNPDRRHFPRRTYEWMLEEHLF